MTLSALCELGEARLGAVEGNHLAVDGEALAGLRGERLRQLRALERRAHPSPMEATSSTVRPLSTDSGWVLAGFRLASASSSRRFDQEPLGLRSLAGAAQRVAAQHLPPVQPHGHVACSIAWATDSSPPSFS